MHPLDRFWDLTGLKRAVTHKDRGLKLWDRINHPNELTVALALVRWAGADPIDVQNGLFIVDRATDVPQGPTPPAIVPSWYVLQTDVDQINLDFHDPYPVGDRFPTVYLWEPAAIAPVLLTWPYEPPGGAGLTPVPPAAHAPTHQHGGSDEVATATPSANAIPKALPSGLLDPGWIPSGGGGDELVGVSANDSTPGHLADKLVSGTSAAVLTEISDGGDEDLRLTISNVVGDSGAGGVGGLVPAPAAGDAAASKTLMADGTWGKPQRSYRLVVSTGPVLITDDLMEIDASGGSVTLVLVTAVGNTSTSFQFKRTDASANSVSIQTVLSQSIDGVTSVSLNSQYESIEIFSNGSNWLVR